MPAATPPADDARVGATRFGPFALRWVEAGEGPTVLALHGIYAGACRAEWDALVPLLTGRATVRALDLLGYGDSDHPDLEHDAELVTAEVAAAIDDAAGDGPPIVLASSLTAAHAVRAVARGSAVAGMCLVTPTGLGGAQTRRSGAVGRTLYTVGRHTPLGDAVHGALVSRPSISWFLRNQAFADGSLVPDELVEAHHRSGTRPNAKHVALAFVTGRLALRLDAAEVARVAPVVLWGRGQSFTDVREAQRWVDAGASWVEVLPSGMPQQEEPQVVADAVLRLVDQVVDQASGSRSGSRSAPPEASSSSASGEPW